MADNGLKHAVLILDACFNVLCARLDLELVLKDILPSVFLV